jgi:acyl-CoA synthetase (AMP-forming)/AMP-acid ligase II
MVSVPLNWRLAPRGSRAIVLDAAVPLVVAARSMWERPAPEMAGRDGVAVLFGPDTAATSGAIATNRRTTRCSVEPDDAALQLSTSETTGRLKGDANLECLLVRGGPAVRVSETCRNLFTLPLFHIAGAGLALITLWSGCSWGGPDGTSPEHLVRAIHEHRMTTTGLVPRGFELSSLETVIYGAAPITPALLVGTLKKIGCGFEGDRLRIPVHL